MSNSWISYLYSLSFRTRFQDKIVLTAQGHVHEWDCLITTSPQLTKITLHYSPCNPKGASFQSYQQPISGKYGLFTWFLFNSDLSASHNLLPQGIREALSSSLLAPSPLINKGVLVLYFSMYHLFKRYVFASFLWYMQLIAPSLSSHTPGWPSLFWAVLSLIL